MKTISKLMTEDHKSLDEIFQEYKSLKNQDYSEAKYHFHNFKIGIMRHIVWEEEIIFPIFEKRTEIIEGGPTAIMREEHEDIKEYLGKISEKIIKHDLNTDEEEKILLDILNSHNTKEEKILYPWIDNALNEVELKRIFDQIDNLEEGSYDKCCV